MLWRITNLLEDDYGCEERGEEEEERVLVFLQNEAGEERVCSLSGPLLDRLGLKEQSLVTLDEAGHICPWEGGRAHE